MKTLLKALYQPYKWLVFMPILGLSGMFFAILAVLISYFFGNRAASMIGGIAWSRVSSFFTPMWVKVRGRENIKPRQSYIVVSNHQSHYDIFVAFGWLFMDIRWVMKKELRKTPFIGYACERLGHVIIDRSDSGKAIESINEAKKNMVNGTSVMFFPEGTRSKDGTIGTFKKGAFKLAIDLKLPILPVTINGTRKILPSGTMDLMPGRAEMIIHPPIETTGYTDKTLDQLITQTRSVIVADFVPAEM